MPDINLDYMGLPKELFLAIYSDNLPKLKELLLNPKQKDYINLRIITQNNHPLFVFALYGDTTMEIVRMLFAHGANPFQVDDSERIPLLYAANGGDPAIVQIVLDAMAVESRKLRLFADFAVDSSKGGTGQNSFHALFSKGCGSGPNRKAKNVNLQACLEVLLKSSVEPIKALNAPDAKGLTPLQLAKANGMHDLLDLLVAKFPQQIDKAAIELPTNIQELLAGDFFGRTTLNEAAFTNNKEVACQEIVNGANVAAYNKQSRRDPLRLACCGIADGNMVNLLLSTGIDAVAKDNDDPLQRPALHYAAFTGKEDTVRALLGEVVEPAQVEYIQYLNAIDSTFVNINQRNTNVAKIRANINVVDSNKWTALHVAASNTARPAGRDKIIDLLFKYGIDYAAKDINGNTALKIARAKAVAAEEDIAQISTQKIIIYEKIETIARANIYESAKIEEVAKLHMSINREGISKDVARQLVVGDTLKNLCSDLDAVNMRFAAANDRANAFKALATKIDNCILAAELQAKPQETLRHTSPEQVTTSPCSPSRGLGTPPTMTYGFQSARQSAMKAGAVQPVVRILKKPSSEDSNQTVTNIMQKATP